MHGLLRDLPVNSLLFITGLGLPCVVAAAFHQRRRLQPTSDVEFKASQ